MNYKKIILYGGVILVLIVGFLFYYKANVCSVLNPSACNTYCNTDEECHKSNKICVNKNEEVFNLITGFFAVEIRETKCICADNTCSQMMDEPEPPTPSGYYPITTSREAIIIPKDSVQQLKISIFNPNEDEITMGLLECENQKNIFFTLESKERKDFGDLFTFRLRIKESSLGKLLHCKITADIGGEVNEKELIIKVI